MENNFTSAREARRRRRRFAAESRWLATGDRTTIAFVVVQEAPQLEAILRQRKARGGRIANLRLVGLAAVIAGLVDQTVPHVEAVFQRLRDGDIVPEEVRMMRYLGRELCVIGATDNDCFGFLIPIGNSVIDVCVKAIKRELPVEHLRVMLLEVGNNIAAVRERVVTFPVRRPLPVAPVADEGGSGNAVTVTCLAELKKFLEQYDSGRSTSSHSTIILGGMVLQDASTAFRLLAGHEGSAVTNTKALEVLMTLEDWLTLAEADIDHFIDVFDGNGNGLAYLEIPEVLYGYEGVVELDPIAPAQRLLDDVEEIVRFGRRAPSFDALAVLGERLVAAARQVPNVQLVHFRASLGRLIVDIDQIKAVWFAFTEIDTE